MAGRVLTGRLITLEWPDVDDCRRMAALRSSPAIRRWFIDDAPTTEHQTREWLACLGRPNDALLAIRFRPNGCFLGTIGWTDWQQRGRTAEFGRLIVDSEMLRSVIADLPDDYPGVALDAAFSLREYAFRHMGLSKLQTCVIEGNHLALRVNRLLGFEEEGRERRDQASGSTVWVHRLVLTRQRWESSPDGWPWMEPT